MRAGLLQPEDRRSGRPLCCRTPRIAPAGRPHAPHRHCATFPASAAPRPRATEVRSRSDWRPLRAPRPAEHRRPTRGWPRGSTRRPARSGAARAVPETGDGSGPVRGGSGCRLRRRRCRIADSPRPLRGSPPPARRHPPTDRGLRSRRQGRRNRSRSIAARRTARARKAQHSFSLRANPQVIDSMNFPGCLSGSAGRTGSSAGRTTCRRPPTTCR